MDKRKPNIIAAADTVENESTLTLHVSGDITDFRDTSRAPILPGVTQIDLGTSLRSQELTLVSSKAWKSVSSKSLSCLTLQSSYPTQMGMLTKTSWALVTPREQHLNRPTLQAKWSWEKKVNKRSRRGYFSTPNRRSSYKALLHLSML